MRRLLALSVLLAFASPAPAVAADAVVERAIEGFVRPAYERLHQATSAVSGAIGVLCKTPSQGNLSAARNGFVDAVDAWSQIEIVRFGPITEANRLERMLFWPDRKSIGLKQVQAALADREPTAADPQQLAGKSVAMQGFGALEYALFGAGADDLAKPGDAYRCDYAKAVASNIDRMASDVSAAWQLPDGFAKTWSSPSPDNPNYHTDDEAMTELLDTLLQGLEMLRDVRIDGFLGKEAGDDKPKQAIFWRSGATVVSLRGNLQGLRAALASSGLKARLPDGDQWLAESADAQFANGLATLSAAPGPIAPALADPRVREKLSFARDVTSSLSATIGTRIAASLGLTAGFSSLDGD